MIMGARQRDSGRLRMQKRDRLGPVYRNANRDAFSASIIYDFIMKIEEGAVGMERRDTERWVAWMLATQKRLDND
jgi:hypothetical protein